MTCTIFGVQLEIIAVWAILPRAKVAGRLKRKAVYSSLTKTAHFHLVILKMFQNIYYLARKVPRKFVVEVVTFSLPLTFLKRAKFQESFL